MTHSIQSQRSNPTCILLQTGLALIFWISPAHAAVTTCIVNSVADDAATANSTVTTTAPSGTVTLRDCILAGNLLTGSTGLPTAGGMSVTFAAGLSGATVDLADDLPLLFNNMTVDASALANPITIDGGSAHRIFFVSGVPPVPLNANSPDAAQQIAVAFKNLVLQHGLAKGGDTAGGGGGMGAGGALFVNQAASVTLNRVRFAGNTAQGGNAGAGGASINGYGGGGMGKGLSGAGGGGLGGGSVGTAGAGLGTAGTAGGAAGGWGGHGLGQISNAQGFNPAYFDVDTGAGASGFGLIGGGSRFNSSGGFGGGSGSSSIVPPGGFGGGSGGCGSCSARAGNGGFGGGGGSATGGITSIGGYGGFGGGGGFGNDGGVSAGGIGGGSTTGNSGGGGAGFGGAVFVRADGELIVQDAGSGDDIAGGAVIAGTGNPAAGAAAGTGLFLMASARTTFDIAGRYSVTDTVADDSLSTLPANQSYSAGRVGGAALTKKGDGTLILSASNTYSGATNVDGGILRITSIPASAVTIAGAGTLTGSGATGSIDSSGTLAPATSNDPQGTLAVIGTLKLEPGSLTCFHANSANNGVSDLHVTGTAMLNGFARIDFSGGPSAGATYALINAAAVGGTFTGLETNMPNLDGYLTYFPTAVTFTVSASDVLFQDGFEPTTNGSPCIAAFVN